MNDRLAALDFIAACLNVRKTPEITAALIQAIASGSINWQRVIGLVNTNLATPTLWTELRSCGLTGHLPPDVRDYLDEVHRLNSLRNEHLREQAIEVAGAFNSIGVEPVLLKGAASLFVRTYDDPGSRVMTDLDILVPRKKTEDCWNLLCTMGYSPMESDFDYSRHNHLRPLRRPGEYAVIEIHRDALLPNCTGRLLGICLTRGETERITHLMRENAEHVSKGDVSMSVPTPTFRVLHCLLHSALAEQNAYREGTLPLRSIHELALMQTVFDEDVAWEEISRLLESGGKLNILHAWVYLAHRVFDSSLPAGWETTPRMVAHYARCRLQARWGWSITLRKFSRV